jgi:hypothetical protein
MVLHACRKLMKGIEVSRVEPADFDNYDEEAEPFTVVDEDKIMAHILDCLALLTEQRKRQGGILTNDVDAQISRYKVFMAALSVVGEPLLGIDKKEQPTSTSNAAADQLLQAFPVPRYLELVNCNRDGWLPLHWAVVLASSDQYDVTEADVKTLYALDPSAMQTKHLNGSGWDWYGFVSFTPAHLLCMSPVTPCSMQLVRLISVCSPMAFTPDATFSALHAACHYGTPTVELLQHLLQLDSSQAKVKGWFTVDDEPKRYPLGQLCFNLVKRADELPNAEDLVKCLLEVDKSEELVGDAVCACLEGYKKAKSGGEAVVAKRSGRLCRMIEMLLKVNPEAAMHCDSNGCNILHLACLNSGLSRCASTSYSWCLLFTRMQCRKVLGVVVFLCIPLRNIATSKC